MERVECPGLPASWLNAWLAAVGLLALEPRLRLSWTSDLDPIAIVMADGETDPMALAVDSWPPAERLTAMPIARRVSGLRDLARSVPVGVFRERTQVARGHIDSWTLSSSLTDLAVDMPDETVQYGDLYPAAPRGTTLHDRLMKCFNEVRSPAQAIPASLGGYGTRVTANGLGFDVTRISALADSSKKRVDPVIEVLAFFGLKLLPTRGLGVEVVDSKAKSRLPAQQRCWHRDSGQPSWHRHMTWPAWTQALDLAGVDALLDLWSELHRARHIRTTSNPSRTLASRRACCVGNPHVCQARSRRGRQRTRIRSDGARCPTTLTSSCRSLRSSTTSTARGSAR